MRQPTIKDFLFDIFDINKKIEKLEDMYEEDQQELIGLLISSEDTRGINDFMCEADFRKLVFSGAGALIHKTNRAREAMVDEFYNQAVDYFKKRADFYIKSYKEEWEQENMYDGRLTYDQTPEGMYGRVHTI